MSMALNCLKSSCMYKGGQWNNIYNVLEFTGQLHLELKISIFIIIISLLRYLCCDFSCSLSALRIIIYYLRIISAVLKSCWTIPSKILILSITQDPLCLTRTKYHSEFFGRFVSGCFVLFLLTVLITLRKRT